jgi:uncharacterized protein YlzI (FlbEa/FlbD family)
MIFTNDGATDIDIIRDFPEKVHTLIDGFPIMVENDTQDMNTIIDCMQTSGI